MNRETVEALIGPVVLHVDGVAVRVKPGMTLAEIEATIEIAKLEARIAELKKEGSR